MQDSLVRRLISKRWLKTILILGALTCVPLMMMWHVLVLDPNVHLSNPGALPSSSTVTDLDGAARLAYLLSDMTYPWSQTHFVSSPLGASVWRFESVTQMIQILFLWILAQLVQPMLAVNLLVLTGWVLTGIVTYLISRRLLVTRLTSILIAIAVQLAPSMRFMAANFTSYAFIAVPLFTVYSILNYFQDPRPRKFSIVLLGLFFTALFDPYWFIFSIFLAAVLFTSFSFRDAIAKKSKQSTAVFLLVLATSFLMLLFVRSLPHFLSDSGIGRTIEMATKFDVQNSVLNFDGWTTSRFTGLGPLVLILFGFCSILVLKKSLNNLNYVILSASLFILISTRVSLPLVQDDLVIGQLTREFMPGVRFYDRAALIALPLLFVVIGKSLEHLTSKMSISWFRVSITPLVLVVLIVSYPNLERPGTTQSFHDWTSIREEIRQNPEPSVLALPFTRRGRDWIEQASFQLPLANDFVYPVNDPQTTLHLSNGPEAFSAYLKSIGVTHLIAVNSEVARFLNFHFTSPRFVPVESIVLNGFGEGEDYKTTVYKVVPQPGDKLCLNCKFGSSVKTEVTITGDLVYPPEISSQGDNQWWIGDNQSIIRFKSMLGHVPNSDKGSKILFRIAKAPCSKRVSIEIRGESFAQTYILNSETPTRDVIIPQNQSAIGTIELNALGEACRFENDPRQLLLQVKNFSFQQ